MLSNSLNRSPTPRSLRLLIVDDKPHVREELSRLLQITGDVEIVGEAADGEEAIRQAEAIHPDVVLMDLEMPLLDGWEATRQIKVRQLAARVVALSIHVDQESTQRALQAGADAVLPKGVEFGSLLNAILAGGDSRSEKEVD
jgi:NarL family two-component system response regulator LiaR